MTTVTAPALGAHQFLRGMPQRHLSYLTSVSSVVKFPAEHRLFSAGGVARHFWLIRAGQVVLDVRAPGDGRVVISSLGRGDLIGLSWLVSPFRWEFGAMTLQPTEAFQIDGAAVRAHCDADTDFGFEFTRRLIVVVIRRLQATRVSMLDRAAGQAVADWP